jgi:tRNA1(Val) A37 N6-methylase TrmN6
VSDALSAIASASDDAFLGGALQILQLQGGYRAGLDAVLLAAAASGNDTRILDVGAGVGVVGLCVARRLAGAHITLVERDPQFAALARANIARNGLADRARVIEADITRPLGECAELTGLTESFDCVLANPPYHAEERGTAAREGSKAKAHAMAEGEFSRWARFMASMARPGGKALVIHKAEALAEILDAFAGRFGNLAVLPIHPQAGAPATRVILLGTKGSRAPLQIRAGLVLHGDDGRFRPEVEAVLRHSTSLPPGALPPSQADSRT